MIIYIIISHTYMGERERQWFFSATKKNKIIHFLNATGDHPIK